MPVLDGHPFRERQKASLAIADIPVLVISGADGALPDAAGTTSS
jgi:hypothetical protein